jgi:hypothetical protein
MDRITWNGIPVLTYGLIGATSMLLAYSVFRDDSSPEPPPAPAPPPPAAPTPAPTPAADTEAESGLGSMLSSVSEVKGGQRKHTRRNGKKKKNKKTKYSR